MMGGHPGWQMPGMSPYGLPLRPPSLGPHGALPPSSFQQPMGIGSPSHYYSRPPDQFVPGGPGTFRHHSPYPQQPLPPNLYNLPPAPSFANQPVSMPPLNVPSPASNSPWDTSAYGRTSTSTGDPGLGQVDFLDLIANNGGSSSNDSSEIDWALLNSGYTPRSEPGDLPESSTTTLPSMGHGNGGGYPVGAVGSPGTVEIEASLLSGTIQQQHSNLRHALEADLSPPQPSPLTPFDPPSTSSSSGQPPQQPMQPLSALPPLLAPIPSRLTAETASSLAIQDSAAETLLQLASHTPRASPEPEHRTSHPIHNFADPWPLSYRPTEKTERLDKGASRAASPRVGPGQSSTQYPQHVPSVTATTRARVLDKVRSIYGEAERFLPRLELLDLFVQLYFDRFSVQMPTLHKPTFDPNTCPSFLLVAVASVGARYAGDRVQGAKMHAQALLETARRMCQVMVSCPAFSPFSLLFARPPLRAELTCWLLPFRALACLALTGRSR